jgi:chromodomain-helicase-DNA-binding protein 3/chromodomain-helicase-DNA-binding protein 4
MGQKNKIKVIRLVSVHTVEERVLEIAKKKLLLEEMFINPLNKMTKKDLEGVIRVGAAELFNEHGDVEDEEIT